MQFICCNRPAVKHHLSYKLQAPLQSVCSVMICQVGSSLSAQSVSSAAMGQLSSAQLLSEGSVATYNSAVRSAAAELHPVKSDETCHLSYNLLAELCSVSPFGLCPLGCSLSAQLCSVSLAVICQLNSQMLAQLQSISSLPLIKLLSAQFSLSGSRCWHQGTVQSTLLIHHHQLRMICCH